MVLVVRRVLCSVDDSDHAVAVARYAARLADALGDELVLLHVVTPTHAPGVSAAPAGRERLRELELQGAEELLARVCRDAGLAADVRRRPEIGDPPQRIVEVCEEEDASHVVLGSRGRGGLTAALLGSVSMAVASHAPCPCVIVSGPAADRLALEAESSA